VSLGLALERGAIDLDGAVLDFTALPDGRAVAVLSRHPSLVLARIDSSGVRYDPIDASLLPGMPSRVFVYDRPVLCRLASGFALVGDEGVVHWSDFDAAPRVLRRVDAFAPNAHGHAVRIAAGAASDDPTCALVILREPQLIGMDTRYARLRLHDHDATWEDLASHGEPRWLTPEAFPAQPTPTGGLAHERPILSHVDRRDGLLRAFVIGSNPNWARWGMSYAMAVRVRDDVIDPIWTAPEACLGTFSASGTFLIATPIRASGPSKGRSFVLELASHELHDVALPRGFTRFQIADHAASTFWLRSRNGDPSRVAIARAK
jgi:hypothetical protein